jgi:hypothetical protein
LLQRRTEAATAEPVGEAGLKGADEEDELELPVSLVVIGVVNGVVTVTECRLEIDGTAYGVRAGVATGSAAESADEEAGMAEEEVEVEGEKRSDVSARALSSQRLRTESTLWLTR